MPQGPGTYGTQQGRPRKDKKKKVVDPKKQQPAQGAPQAPAPARTDMKGRPVIEDGTKREAAIEAEVNQRMTPGGIDTRNQQLEQEGFLKPGDADRMRRTSREYDATFNRPQESARTQSMDAGNQMMSNYRQNQQAKEANRMQTPEQQQENAARREERRIAREAKNAQRDSEKLAEFEASGFEGTQEEYFEDKFNASPAGIAREERRVKRVAREKQERIDGKARTKARQERYREKQERRSDMNARYMEAKRMGLTPGTPEFIEFAGGGRGQQDAREQALEMARITSGEGVAEITTQGQVTVQGMLGEQRFNELTQQGVNEQALQGLINEGIDLTNKSNQEIQRMIEEGATTRTKLTDKGETTREETRQTGETTRTEMTEEGETTRTKTTTQSQEAMNKASIDANQALAEMQNDITLKQIKQTGWLANKQLDNDAFNKQMEMAFAASNTNAERLAQFGIANGQFMTPEQNELFQTRLMQMDGGKEALSKLFGPGSDTNVLGQTRQVVEDEAATIAADEELASRKVGDIEFETKDQAKDWNDASFKFMEQDGEMSPTVKLLEDVDEFTDLADPKNATRMAQFKGAVGEMQNVVNQLVDMPQDQMMKAAEQFLTQTGVEKLQEGWMPDAAIAGEGGGHAILKAKRGFLEFLYQAKAGRKDLPTNWNSGIDELGLGIQPITP